MAEKTSRVVAGRGAARKGPRKPKTSINPKNWDEFVKNCSDVQREAAERIKEINDRRSADELRSVWLIGRAIAEIQEEEAKFGKGFIAKLSKQLNDNTSHVYKQKSFFSWFPAQEDIERVMSLRLNGRARYLSFTSHIIPILEKKLTPEQRWEGLETAAREGWSGKQLKNWINATIKKPANRRSASGRKRVLPEPPQDLLPYLSESFADMRKTLETMIKPDSGVCSILNKTTADMILPSWCEHLKTTLEEMSTTSALIANLQPDLRAALARYEQAANHGNRTLPAPDKANNVPAPSVEPKLAPVEDPDLAKLFPGI